MSRGKARRTHASNIARASLSEQTTEAACRFNVCRTLPLCTPNQRLRARADVMWPPASSKQSEATARTSLSWPSSSTCASLFESCSDCKCILPKKATRPRSCAGATWAIAPTCVAATVALRSSRPIAAVAGSRTARGEPRSVSAPALDGAAGAARGEGRHGLEEGRPLPRLLATLATKAHRTG